MFERKFVREAVRFDLKEEGLRGEFPETDFVLSLGKERGAVSERGAKKGLGTWLGGMSRVRKANSSCNNG